jgi:ElaA protein
MRWEHRAFAELTVDHLYGVLKLRQEVFVVEQHCPYLDADGLDRLASHLFAVVDESIVACARIFAPGVRTDAAIIGRVVVDLSLRRRGVGRELMQRAVAAIEHAHGRTAICLGAQKYLEQFYASFGFTCDGEDYLEDGILHLPMRRTG